MTPLSRVVSAPPPRDMEMTEGRPVERERVMTQLIPATMPEVLPEPASERTLTAIKLAFLATP